ncbi:MAG: carboxypeptidase regulatory-like domain-containing protein [Planctomycetes bacterium]|nr:carboxypeptidase regulatory-like domain-containing protein [Planctomycetota bacterium]
MKARTFRLSLGGLALGLLAAAVWWWLTQPPREKPPVIRPAKPAAEAPGRPTAEPADYLGEKAKELGFNVDRIASFVRGEVAPEKYEGVLHGPVGSLWAGAGNVADRVLLLKGLLDKCPGVESRLVKGEALGVEARVTGSSFRYLGPALPEDPAAQLISAIPEELYHTIELVLITRQPEDEVEKETIEFRIADLAGRNLRILYRRHGDATVAVIQGPGSSLVSKVDAGSAVGQEVLFRARGPGQNLGEVRRELFTKDFEDTFPSRFHPSNRYTITVTSGWVPRWVLEREEKAAPAFDNQADAVAHLVAYTFLCLSDENTRWMSKVKGVQARFLSPRVTIVSDEQVPHAEAGRSLSLDLRKNDITVEADDSLRLAFMTLRSLYDASIESLPLGRVTGQAATSAADLLANRISQTNRTPPERLTVFTAALTRLLDEEPEGAAVTLSSEAEPAFSVRFEKKESGIVAIPSTAVATAIPESADDIRSLFASSITGDLEGAAVRADAAVIVAAKVSPDYPFTLAYSPPRSERWYDSARVFTFFDGKLEFERQYSFRETGVVVEFIDYYDELEKKWNEPPSDGSVEIRKEALEKAKLVTAWYREDDADPTIGMFSRKCFQELKTTGSTVVRYLEHNRTVTDPLRLWTVSREPRRIVVNNEPLEVFVLVLAGDFEKNNPAKPEDVADFPDRYDQTQTHVINKWEILDDPRLPLCLYGEEQVQSVIPGQVTDAYSARGIAGATVTVTSNATQKSWTGDKSWPSDGRFMLPIITEPFGVFTISVEADGYLPVNVSRDFRQKDALPLNLKLQPVPDRWETVDRSNLEVKLSKLDLSERSKHIITEAIKHDGDLVALIPPWKAFDFYGEAQVWLEVNTRTGETYPRMVDGLYGATTLGPPSAGGATGFGLALQKLLCKSALKIGEIALAIEGGSAVTQKARLQQVRRIIDGYRDTSFGPDIFADALKEAIAWIQELQSRASEIQNLSSFGVSNDNSLASLCGSPLQEDATPLTQEEIEWYKEQLKTVPMGELPVYMTGSGSERKFFWKHQGRDAAWQTFYREFSRKNDELIELEQKEIAFESRERALEYWEQNWGRLTPGQRVSKYLRNPNDPIIQEFWRRDDEARQHFSDVVESGLRAAGEVNLFWVSIIAMGGRNLANAGVRTRLTREAAKRLTDRFRQLAWDPGRGGKHNWREAVQAFRFESKTGIQLSRGTHAGDDFVAGRVKYSFTGGMNPKYFEYTHFTRRISDKLLDSTVKVVVDISTFTRRQVAQVRSFIDKLPAADKARIVIME